MALFLFVPDRYIVEEIITRLHSLSFLVADGMAFLWKLWYLV